LQRIVIVAAEGTTVLFSSHQLADVERIADDEVMLDRGVYVLEASLDELRADYRLITLGFAEAPAPTALHMPGVYSVRASGRQLAVSVSENAEAVVQRARELGATSIKVSRRTRPRIAPHLRSDRRDAAVARLASASYGVGFKSGRIS
jgi:ABC-2 type transport system ATP-binding protein